jgi:hypothetical protein
MFVHEHDQSAVIGRLSFAWSTSDQSTLIRRVLFAWTTSPDDVAGRRRRTTSLARSSFCVPPFQ